MPVWLKIIAANAFIGLICYARGLYKELKSTEEKLGNTKQSVKDLKAELKEAYYRLNMYEDNTKNKGGDAENNTPHQE